MIVALVEAADSTLPGVQPPVADADLAPLKAWRLERAEGKPAYTVATDATLREVVRCTRDGITINTFMLERSPYMVQFINDLMRINTGRVFVATPDRLGEYILVDYVTNKRKFVA